MCCGILGSTYTQTLKTCIHTHTHAYTMNKRMNDPCGAYSGAKSKSRYVYPFGYYFFFFGVGFENGVRVFGCYAVVISIFEFVFNPFPFLTMHFVA